MRFDDWSIGLDAIAVLVLAGYHLRLWLDIRRRPAATVVGSNRLVRERWVARIIEEKLDLLAVQTMRNWTMAATFLASTAIAVALGALHLLTTGLPGGLALFSAEGALTAMATPLAAKALIVALILFAAFFNFTQTLRNFNHACFLLAVPGQLTPEYIARVVSRGANHYTLGMRAYYLAIPTSLWLFGSPIFLAASLGLVALLARIDYL